MEVVGLETSGTSGEIKLGTVEATAGNGGSFGVTAGTGNTAAGGSISLTAGESTGGDGGPITFTTGHDKTGSTTGAFTTKTEDGSNSGALGSNNSGDVGK